MATSRLQIIIEAIDKASGTLGKVGKSLKSTGDKLADIRKPALIATAAIGGMVIAGIKLSETAGKYASVRDAFKSMTEDMGVSVDQFEKDVAKASAGTLDKLTILRGGTRALSLMGRESFEDFGSEFAKMAELSKKAARATGQEVTYMFDSLITGMSRESKMILDNLGITVDLTQAKKDYAAQLGREVDEMTIAEEKRAVLLHTLGKLEENYADVAVSAGGFSGAMSTMKAAVKDAQIEIGEALTPAFNELVRSITPLIKEYVPQLVEKIKELVKWFAELSPIGKKILLSFLAIAPAIVAVTTAGIMFIKVFKPITLLLIALVATTYLFYRSWVKIAEGLKTTWETISKIAQTIFGGIRDYFVSHWEETKAVFLEAAAKIKEIILGILEFLGFWQESVIEIFTTIGDFLKGMVIVWKEFLRPIWEPIMEANSEFLVGWAADALKIMDIFGATWTAVRDQTMEYWGLISDIIKEAADVIGLDITEKFTTIADFLYGIWEKIRGVFAMFLDGIKIAWGAVWDWVVNKIQWVYDRIKAIIDRMREIVAPIMDLARGIGAGISGAISRITAIGAGVEGYQRGGVVPGIGARLAMVHGGETIIPQGRRMGGDINIYIQGGTYLDREAGEKFAKILGKMLRRELRYQRGY